MAPADGASPSSGHSAPDAVAAAWSAAADGYATCGGGGYESEVCMRGERHFQRLPSPPPAARRPDARRLPTPAPRCSTLAPRFLPWSRHALALLAPHAPCLPPGTVAVPGCGPGLELPLVAAALPGRALVASDTAPRMVALATARAPPGCTVRLGDARALPPLSHAALASFFVLQALPDPGAALGAWVQSLKPGGVAAVAFWPSRGNQPDPAWAAATSLGGAAREGGAGGAGGARGGREQGGRLPAQAAGTTPPPSTPAPWDGPGLLDAARAAGGAVLADQPSVRLELTFDSPDALVAALTRDGHLRVRAEVVGAAAALAVARAAAGLAGRHAGGGVTA